MQTRKSIQASQLPELYDQINRQLDRLGIESQPAVAARLTELIQDPEAGPVDFAQAIRNDAAISGRLLKLSNSAAFGQAREVTSIDRACMLMGQERLRSMALGFYLSRSATDPDHEELSRRVWGESVLRGCLAAELARETHGVGVPEAFLVGLLLDSGVSVMNRMLKSRYETFTAPEIEPEELFRLEFESLPMTHVDVAAALCRRWRLPDVLSKPIAWHHTPPPARPPETDVQRMQRIAYCAGLVSLREGVGADVFVHEARSRLGLQKDQLDALCTRALAEYKLTIDLFDSVAQRSPGASALMDMVHQRLVDAHDDLICADGPSPAPAALPRFTLGSSVIEIERTDSGVAVAYLIDDNGDRIIAHHFMPSQENAATIAQALAIRRVDGDESPGLEAHLRAIAA